MREYIKPQMNVTEFDCENILTTSSLAANELVKQQMGGTVNASYEADWGSMMELAK